MPAPEAPQQRAARIQLGVQLRSLREAAGLTGKRAAEAIGVDPSRMTRLEQGTAALRTKELENLIRLYRAASGTADELRELGTDARRRSRKPGGYPWITRYVTLQSAAAEIKQFHCELISGIAQTEDYARALMRSGNYYQDDDRLEEAITARIARQGHVLRDGGPHVWVVMGEPVLHYEVGGPPVLRQQLEHLVDLSTMNQITMQIVPFSAGEHMALGQPFTIFKLGAVKAGVVYLEHLFDAAYLDDPAQVDRYDAVFNLVLGAALSERDSVRLIKRRIKELHEGAVL